MSGKAADAGKLFIEQVLAKIADPEKRAVLAAAFADPSAADALVVAGTGALGQSEISRRFDELKTKESVLAEDYDKLNTWFADKKDALEDYEKIKKGAAPGGPPSPTAPPTTPTFDDSKFVSREDFTATMQREQLAAANYLGLQNVLTLKHYKDFNEVLDTRELLADKNLGKTKPDGATYGLMDAYQTKFSTQLTERAQKDEASRIQTLVDAKVSETLKGMPQQPFIVRDGGGSPLDALNTTTPDASQYTAEAAANEYARLQQARQGA